MEPIIRRSPPTKLDTAEFGTECLVFVDAHACDVYVQYGHNEEDPKWECMERRFIKEDDLEKELK